ncbi:MAG: GMC oxidoreductase, partial [Candidatus Latescibacteria bacterium]|nr:GMC oxidoreductase [Candidatus Latescibacterota bacterium]
DPLELSNGNKDILNDLQKHSALNDADSVLFGQARLLVKSTKGSIANGCKYCGYCMSGCVYGCIYKSSQDIDKFIASNLIDYIPKTLVHSVSENENDVGVLVYKQDTGKTVNLTFDKILIAAGAVNSCRIVLRSKNIFNKTIRLLSTVTFIAPVFRLKRTKIDWPNVNTEPGIFLEYKTNTRTGRWIHTQLSTPNEMVLERLGIDLNKNNISQWIKRKLVDHLIVAHGNIHSDDANGYFLTLEKATDDKMDVLHSRREQIERTRDAIHESVWTLFKILRRIGCYVMLPLVQNSIQSGGFHVGGTLPMMKHPIAETDTNLLGNPKGWRRIHVIDSSVFPSLPATTPGLLAMANAARIASEIVRD